MFSSNPIQKLQDKSAKILDVFTKTVTELEAVNLEVDRESREREEEKAKIDQELAELAVVKDNNGKMIGKLKKILE